MLLYRDQAKKVAGHNLTNLTAIPCSAARSTSTLTWHAATGEECTDHTQPTQLKPLYSVAKAHFNTGLAHCCLKSVDHVAAGEKLIDHLKKWLDTTKLLETPHSWEPGQESDIAAAILELFHLLPPQAAKFLETQGVSLLSCAHLATHACLGIRVVCCSDFLSECLTRSRLLLQSYLSCSTSCPLKLPSSSRLKGVSLLSCARSVGQ